MENNNKNKYIVIGVIVVILALVSVPLMRKFRAGQVVDNSANEAEVPSGTKTFSGTISAVNTGCFADGVFSVTIDGKKIILVQGGLSVSPSPVVGRLIGVNSVGDLEKKIGAFANVYAALTPEGDYTIYGNSDYFVEVVMTSDK